MVDYKIKWHVILLFQMEVVEEKQHEGVQQYYVTKIEELQVKE